MAYELEQTAALLWPHWGFREWIIVVRVVVRTRSRGWPVDRNVHRQRRLASSAIVGCTLVAIGVFIRVWYYRMLRPCPASAVDERRSNNSFMAPTALTYECPVAYYLWTTFWWSFTAISYAVTGTGVFGRMKYSTRHLGKMGKVKLAGTVKTGIIKAGST